MAVDFTQQEINALIDAARMSMECAYSTPEDDSLDAILLSAIRKLEKYK